jgi:hypothetical protein
MTRRSSVAEGDRRAKVADVEAEELARINKWMLGRPGVFGPFRDPTSCWQEAFRAFGGSRCGLGFFQWHLRRAGYDMVQEANGHRLDLSDPALIAAETE